MTNTYESIATSNELAIARTEGNASNSLTNILASYERSGAIFPVSGDILATFRNR